MNKNYYDKNGEGRFTKWFREQEMEINDMEEELQDGNVKDCSYLEFDANFPLDPSINDKQKAMFKIIQYCYKHGEPPRNENGEEKENIDKESNEDSDSDNDESEANKSVTVDSYWKLITSTKLAEAIQEGKLGVLKYWGAEAIEKKLKGNKNALHLACEYGKLGIVKWLINKCGFDLEKTDNILGSEKTAFFYAVKGGSIEVLNFLKKKGANMNVMAGRGNENLLFSACEAYDTSVLEKRNDEKGKMEVIEWLLKHSNRDKKSKFYINLEITIVVGNTPFLWAAERGLLAIAQLLRKDGANIHAKNRNGDNALHLVCKHSESAKMVEWLLDECKIGLETEGYDKKTPFLCAAEKGKLGIAQLLRKQGANVSAKDKDEDNALHLACLWSRSVDMVAWLLDECDIGLETKGCDKRTPFLSAAKTNSTEVVKLLKHRGANIHATDEDGDNALQLAWEEEMIRYLKSLGLS